MGPNVSSRLTSYLERARALAPLIRSHADRSEREAQLVPEVVEALHESGLFRILLPVDMQGGALTVPESLRIFEEVARIDGSAGWNMAICANGPLFCQCIARRAFDEIFSDPRSIVAGSLNPTNIRAVTTANGWRLSGKASYVSGSAHASWLMAAGVVLENGQPRFVDGVPLMRAGLFPMRHCRILDTWSVSGMRGTGSNDCVFEDVPVSADFTFDWPQATATWQTGAFAVVPLATQLGGGLAAVALGIARHAIEALIEIAVAKVPVGTRATLRDRPLAQMQIAQAEGLLEAARAYLFDANDEVWRRGESGEAFDTTARARARLAAVTAARLAAQSVDLIFDAAGATAIQTSCPIERCWRDVHAITQHVILSTGRYEVIGRVLFGLDPGSPII